MRNNIKSINSFKKGYASGRLIGSQTNKPLSQEHKNKISISRIKFLKENPDQVPYLLNHYSKEKVTLSIILEKYLKIEI